MVRHTSKWPDIGTQIMRTDHLGLSYMDNTGPDQPAHQSEISQSVCRLSLLPYLH